MKALWIDIPADAMNVATDARHFGCSKAPVAVLGIDGGDCHTDAEWVGIKGIGEMAQVICDYCQG